ncbi:(Fe-S)-binding protein [Candidatus Poribacteria bacterium]|nr:(Fe-S)-binding protein [Candidatus Poribacteria bacterium]
MIDLENLKNEIIRCNRCGSCRAVCPVFRETGKETMVARGRMEIIESILKNKIDFSEITQEIINSCILCGACSDNCPSSVKVDTLVRMARCAKVEKYGLGAMQEFILRYVLENRSIFSMAIDSAYYFQKFFTIKSSNDHMRHLPLFLTGIEKGRAIPKVAHTRLSKMYPEIISPAKRKLRVGFFPGCLYEYVYTNIGKSIIDVLIKNDVEVVLPSKLKCCGFPVLAAGDEKEAKKLAMNNVKAFSSYDLDAIIAGCASCGNALKNEYQTLLEDADIAIDNFTAKVKDITEFIADNISYMQKINFDLDCSVTYHDPCHLRRKQKIINQPRDILKNINKLSFIEMAEASDCCGGGGSFNLHYYEIANKMRNRKIKNIENTNAEYVATTCPGCIMHIADGFIQKKSNIKVVHVMELLNKAII